MSLTPKQAFRLGFLTKCAEQQLQPEEVKEFVKSANSGAALAGGAVRATSRFPFSYPLWAGFGASVLGLGGGAVLGNAMQTKPDVEDVKRQELQAALLQHADRFRRNTRNRRYRQSTPPPFEGDFSPVARLTS